MDVIDRVDVEPSTGCSFIQLGEREKDIYTGAGEHLAAFQDGELVELFNIMNQTVAEDGVEAEANAILGIAVAWLNDQQAQGRMVMAVMCSCHSLCDPEIITYPDGVARLARRIGDAVARADADGW